MIWPSGCIVLLALILLSPVIIKHEFWTGFDTYFHMNSIYDDAMQIKTGHFSYFLSMFGFERSGRIVNSLYGPGFNYICGALLLWLHGWVRFEFFVFFIVMIVSGFEVYCCGRQLHFDRSIATVLAMFYMISRPLLSTWIGNFGFTGLGAGIFLPLVLIAGIKILQQRRIRILLLAILIAACLQVHLVTSLVAVVMLIPFTFCGFILTKEKARMIKHGIAAAILAFCLSGNVFGALIDVFSTNHLIPTFPKLNLQTTAGGNTINIQNHMINGMGRPYTIMLIVIFVLMMIRFKRVRLLDCCLLFEDLFFMWISSTYFPWNRLMKIDPNLSTIIQFPTRFLPVAFLSTLILLGRVIYVPNHNWKWQKVVNVALAVSFICSLEPMFITMNQKSQAWQSPQVINYGARQTRLNRFGRPQIAHQIRAAVRSPQLSKGLNVAHKTTLDYLPTLPKLNIYNYYQLGTFPMYAKTFLNQQNFRKSTKDHEILMSWQNRGTREMTVPLVKYGNTQVILNHHVIHPKTTMIGTMQIRPRNGMNRIQMKYQPGGVFKFLAALSILSWMFVMIALFYRGLVRISRYER